MSAEALDRLTTRGFVVVPGPFRGSELPATAAAYDAFVAAGEPRTGSRSVRTGGLSATRYFDGILTYPLLIAAAEHVVGADFKLSAFHTRSLIPGTRAPRLHRDVEIGQDGWPLLGFIFMVDAFTPENGATRFVSGSHRGPSGASGCECACGSAGSLILFDGSALHDHGANDTPGCRRSIQGAMIPRNATSAVDHSQLVRAEDRDCLAPRLRYLFCL